MVKRFNIRVYGILINDKNEVLMSDECRNGNCFTKFPGGGLEWGESTIDCLKREFMEELNTEIKVNELFYCTDFFQQSAFRKDDQLISLYYKVEFLNKNSLNFAKYELPMMEDGEKFRWMACSEISANDVTFPIDKLVAGMLNP